MNIPKKVGISIDFSAHFALKTEASVKFGFRGLSKKAE
jgi:hypothetical protein